MCGARQYLLNLRDKRSFRFLCPGRFSFVWFSGFPGYRGEGEVGRLLNTGSGGFFAPLGIQFWKERGRRREFYFPFFRISRFRIHFFVKMMPTTSVPFFDGKGGSSSRYAQAFELRSHVANSGPKKTASAPTLITYPVAREVRKLSTRAVRWKLRGY